MSLYYSIIYNLLLRFAKLFGDYEFFNDFDGEILNFAYFLFIDILKNKSESDKKLNLENDTPGNIHYEINEIFNNIKRKLQNRLEKYNSLIKSLKIERDKEEEEKNNNELFQESEANKKEITFIDLFAGCGGLSLGALKAGYSGILSVERQKNAFDTFRNNLIDNSQLPN